MPGSNSGIYLDSLVSGDHVTIGPGVAIDGAYVGIVGASSDSAQVTLTGSPSAPTTITNTAQGCANAGAVHDITTTVAGTRNVILSTAAPTDCTERRATPPSTASS